MGAIYKTVLTLAEEVGANLGYEVYDLELLDSGRKSIVRVFIDKPGGVGIDDCTAFSRDFAALMDVEDPIRGRFTLEVSSPGMDRPLKTPAHWQNSIGKLARVVLLDPEPGRDVITARIEAFDGSRVTLEEEGGGRVELDLDKIKRARLEVEL